MKPHGRTSSNTLMALIRFRAISTLRFLACSHLNILRSHSNTHQFHHGTPFLQSMALPLRGRIIKFATIVTEGSKALKPVTLQRKLLRRSTCIPASQVKIIHLGDPGRSAPSKHFLRNPMPLAFLLLVPHRYCPPSQYGKPIEPA